MVNIEIYQGDVRQSLATMPDNSIHCVITSPPYWGLRDYGLEPLVWGGREDCEHEWGEEIITDGRKYNGDRDGGGVGQNQEAQGRQAIKGQFCRRCSAWRGSLGLEPTISLYLEHLVEIFREVKRVLRPDGVLFLNLGDSYVANRGNTQEKPGYDNKSAHGGANLAIVKHRKDVDGLKPKDLCGIPWRVAFALQQPYYTGKIKNEKDRVWLAAMIDGEGCMFLHKRKEGQSNGQGYFRKNDSYGAGLEVANVHPSIIERCQQITGLGSICCVERETKTKKRNIPLYRWSLRSNQCREVIREIYPYLVGKQHEARLLLGCPSSGHDAEKAHASLIALHNAKEATIDFPAPSSMWEPGWYLRSDVIWAKLNPMPESCTDRPTKSHEYIFLLTKSAKYFWDAEAVREEAKYGRRETGNGMYYQLRNNDPKDKREARAVTTKGENPERGRNLRTVWEIATEPFPEAHFATFPQRLVQRCLQAGTSERGCCPKCGAPWRRVVEKESPPMEVFTQTSVKEDKGDFLYTPRKNGIKVGAGQKYQNWRNEHPPVTTGWTPTCTCNLPETQPCTILDPFGGSGTAALVAGKMGLNAVICELKPEYVEMARQRLTKELGMLANISVKGYEK